MKKKRLLAWVLTLAMVLSMIPITAMAEVHNEVQENHEDVNLLAEEPLEVTPVGIRTSSTTATVKISSNRKDADCVYSYVAFEQPSNIPENNDYRDIAYVTDAKKIDIIRIEGLSNANAKDVYVKVKDKTAVEELVVKVEIPAYKTPNNLVVDNASQHLNNTLNAMLKNTPAPVQETNSGDWTVMTLARGGFENIPEGYYEAWKNIVDEKMKEKKGNLHNSKYTEFSRLMLPLNALGYDVTNVGEYNILEKYADFSKVSKQGTNGPIWGLIALDTNNYLIDKAELDKVPEAKRNSRKRMIKYTLDNEIVGGGFALTGTTPDPDMTAMALQAMVPYYGGNDLLKAEFGNNTAEYNQMLDDIKGFVDRGITVLSELQRDDGDYDSWGTVNLESTAQVVVTLVGLGIDPMTDERFIKNGNTLLDGMMKYAIEGGGFAHSFINDPENPGANAGQYNGMATDQGGYALVAYKRFKEGKTWLYDMSDVAKNNRPDTYAPKIYFSEAKLSSKPKEVTGVYFKLNEPATYYLSGDNANVDMSGTGTKVTSESILKEKIVISLEEFNECPKKSVYIQAEDIHGNKMSEPIEVNIERILPQSIEVATPPTKTAYKVGESFDKSGMVIIAKYIDGHQETITNYTVDKKTFAKEDIKIVISYLGKTAEVPVTVTENTDGGNTGGGSGGGAGGGGGMGSVTDSGTKPTVTISKDNNEEKIASALVNG
ncbi:MAG: bacterial Ig-like domain-containing protein, partial [Aminipila sp.]